MGAPSRRSWRLQAASSLLCSSMMARVTCPLPMACKECSTLVRTAETPLSQASSSAFSRGIGVVVGAAVVGMVAGAAVGLAESSPHPPISTASRIRVASRMAERPVVDKIRPLQS